MSVAVVAAMAFYIPRGIFGLHEAMDLAFRGIGGLVSVILLIVLAFVLSATSRELETGVYFASLVQGLLSPAFVPVALFLMSHRPFEHPASLRPCGRRRVGAALRGSGARAVAWGESFPMPSHNRVAIITGAGSGIGRAVAVAFLEEGYRVVLAGRRRELLALDAPSERALAVPTDVREPASVRALFASTKEAFGRLDVLFNNAGINAPGTPLEDLSYEEWRAVVDTNVTGVFLCTREAFKIMKSQVPRGGRIINNGSISAHTPRPDSAPYTATKHAVTGLTKSTALDGRKYDIACGQIDVGNAATELTARMGAGVRQADGSTAPEPTIDVRHVAEAVLYMASLPLDANVLSLTVMATKMPFVGRG